MIDGSERQSVTQPESQQAPGSRRRPGGEGRLRQLGKDPVVDHVPMAGLGDTEGNP